jgi:hypothetical protein
MEKSFRNFSVEVMESSRGKAAWFAQASATSLVKVDQHIPGRVEVGQLLHTVPDDAARLDYAPF